MIYEVCLICQFSLLHNLPKWKLIPGHTVQCRNKIPKLLCLPGDTKETKYNHSASSSDWKKVNSLAEPSTKCVLAVFCTFVFPFSVAKQCCEKLSSLYLIFFKKKKKVASVFLSQYRKGETELKICYCYWETNQCFLTTTQWPCKQLVLNQKYEIVPLSNLLTE